MKSVWITGASSGIGKALAELLASKGFRVIATARDENALQALKNNYPSVDLLVADLTSEEDCQRVQTYFTHRNLPLDVVVVNAGTCEYMDIHRFSADALMSVFSINMFAAAKTIAIAQPYLQQSSVRGHIVGISSMSVYMPFAKAQYYGASKAAFTYYLKSLALELQAENIDVSIAYPGFIDTPLTQKNQFAMPFLISAEAAAEQLLKVIRCRPKAAAFPKPLHYVLRILSLYPSAWYRFVNVREKS